MLLVSPQKNAQIFIEKLPETLTGTDLNLFKGYISVGRCGPVGLFVMYKSATAPRVDGSHPGSSSFFVGTTRQLQLDSLRRKRIQQEDETMWTVKTRKRGSGSGSSDEGWTNRQANVARGREKGFRH